MVNSEAFLNYVTGQQLTVYSHQDADGLTASALLASVATIKEIIFPMEFGEIPATPPIPGTLVLDMVPTDPKLQGVVVDHHPRHPEKEKRSYELINLEVPTCLAIYNLLKDKIPPEKTWIVMAGLMGEGHVDLAPAEICDRFPILFEKYEWISEKYGDLNAFGVPVYFMLSSGINNVSRMRMPMEAYKILKAVRGPIELLENDACQQARDNMKNEQARVIKDSNAISFGKFRVWPIHTEYGIESILASRISEKTHLTTLVVNTKTGKMSCRGVLTTWLATKLRQYGHQLDGHPGYMGGKLVAPFDKLMDDLKHIE